MQIQLNSCTFNSSYASSVDSSSFEKEVKNKLLFLWITCDLWKGFSFFFLPHHRLLAVSPTRDWSTAVLVLTTGLPEDPLSFSFLKKLLKEKLLSPLFVPTVACETARLCTPDLGHGLLLCQTWVYKEWPMVLTGLLGLHLQKYTLWRPAFGGLNLFEKGNLFNKR